MKTNRRFLALLTVLVLLLAALPPPSMAETVAYVKGGWLRLRSAKSTSSQILGSYPTGTKVFIESNDGTWCYVRIATSGKHGYMMSEYLSPAGAVTTSTPPSSSLYIRYITSGNGKFVNLRMGPAYSHLTIASYRVGTPVKVHGYSGSWAHVTVNGKEGYMLRSFLSEYQVYGPSKASSYSNTTARITNTTGNVALRTSAANNATVIRWMANNLKVNVLYRGAAWSFISRDGQVGYVRSQYLSGSESSTPASGTKAYVVNTSKTYVNLRAYASLSAGVLMEVPYGTQVTIVTRGATWSWVQVGKTYGYMMTKYLTTKKP